MFEYIQDAHLVFKGALSKRAATKTIVIHHLAGRDRTVTQVHNDEIKANGWIGIGYNIYIRQDGTAWWGRGIDTIGAHAGRKVNRSAAEWAAGATNNSESIGIGFEGYYHPWPNGKPDKTMPKAQYDMGVRIIRDILKKYGNLAIKGHKEMPATSTACPGDYFPLKEMIADGRKTEAETPTAATVPAKSEYMVRITEECPILVGKPKVYATLTSGAYTIVEESNGYGKLKSGAGWIYLGHTKKI